MAELADVELDAAALKNVAGGDCYAVDGCMEKGVIGIFAFAKTILMLYASHPFFCIGMVIVGLCTLWLFR